MLLGAAEADSNLTSRATSSSVARFHRPLGRRSLCFSVVDVLMPVASSPCAGVAAGSCWFGKLVAYRRLIRIACAPIQPEPYVAVTVVMIACIWFIANAIDEGS